MPRVLLVEDEAVLRSSIARGLSRMPQIEVYDVMTVTEAVALLDSNPPDMIISDIDLPDRSGIEILGELGSRGIDVPVVFVSAYLKAYRAQIPRHANVEVLEKPVGIDELRDLVSARTARRATTGAPFSAPDYLQLSCMGRHSVVISIAQGANRLGAIYVVSGEVWAAVDGHGAGPEAFRRLAFLEDTDVACQTLLEDPPERTLHGSWESLLLDSARVFDEGGGDAPDLIGLDDDWDLDFDTPSVTNIASADTQLAAIANTQRAETADADPSPLDDRQAFAEIWDEGVGALLRKDFVAAVSAFSAALALKPEDPSVVANLERLREMGYEPEHPIDCEEGDTA